MLKFTAIFGLLLSFSTINISRAGIINSYKACISNENLTDGKEKLVINLENRIKSLKLRETSIIEKQKLLSELTKSWNEVQEHMMPLSVASLVIPGVAVGKIAASFDYANIARTAYAASVISKEMLDYYLVGTMTTILFGGVLFPTTYSYLKYSAPELNIRDCNSSSKVIVYENYIDLNGNFMSRTKKNDAINQLLSKAEKKLVNQFEPGFWHFTKNALTFGIEEAIRLSQISNILISQAELINQELHLLDKDISQIKVMKACSQVCDITVE